MDKKRTCCWRGGLQISKRDQNSDDYSCLKNYYKTSDVIDCLDRSELLV